MRLSFPRPARLWPVFLSLLPALLMAETRFSFERYLDRVESFLLGGERAN